MEVQGNLLFLSCPEVPPQEFVGVGIQPDITVQKKLKDYLNNNDPALNKAIDYLKKKE